MLEAEPEQMDDPLTMLAEREDIISDTVDGTVFIYLPEMYEAETYCAGRLMTALASSPPKRCGTIPGRSTPWKRSWASGMHRCSARPSRRRWDRAW